MNQQVQTQINIAPPPKLSFATAQDLSLQRKCACGGPAWISGKCDECRKNSMLGVQTPRVAAGRREPAEINPPGEKFDFGRVRIHADSPAKVFRASSRSEAGDGNGANATEDSEGVDDENALSNPTASGAVKRDADGPDKGAAESNSGKAAKCSDEVDFSLRNLRSSLELDNRAARLGADGRLVIPNVGFQLNATVSAEKHKGIKDKQVRQWRLGVIQNVHRSRAQLDYSDPKNRIDLIDCGLSDQKETHVDCDNGGPWYNPPKRAFVRFPRFLRMSDHPQLEQVDLVNARRSVLRRIQRDFSASAFVVAEKNGSFCPLSRVDWGFHQDDLFTPNVVVDRDGVSPVGVGKIEKNIQFKKPVEHGPGSTGTPLTGAECKPQPPFGECPEEAGELRPASRAPESSQGPQAAAGAASSPGVKGGTARQRFGEDHIQRPGANISSTTPTPPGETVRESDTARSSDEDLDANESEGSSPSTLKERIQKYRDACSGIASVKCVGGEIVKDLPKCIEEAPCGIAECVKRHELSHAADIVSLFQSELGRHPCRRRDGTPFADGFEGFGEDFETETGERRKWKTFLLRSERKAYGMEVKCLREMRRNSKERLCKRALTFEAAKSSFRRFLAAIGINPGV